ncbi:MAG: serine/threonine-protein kinase [Thermodesulfobacteriota bacterium]
MGFLDSLFGKRKALQPEKDLEKQAAKAAKPLPPEFKSPVSSPPSSFAPKSSESVRVSPYAPGAIIAGRYEVVGQPLMGGMGIIYMCFDRLGNIPVALKTFRPEYLPDREARDRFLREGATWVSLGSHPHIVRCYLVINVKAEVYLLLELVAKEKGHANASLRSWLVPGKPLPVEQSLLFSLQIVRGMTHAVATTPDLVHRDLKPENVLVGRDILPSMGVHRLRVTDFGLAAVIENLVVGQRMVEDNEVESPARLGRTQLMRGVVGTPLYMAPEQWKGEGVRVQTDIYALGCILYEMLAGQRVVEGRSLAALERAHCEGDVRGLPSSLPGAVAKVVLRCLALDPGARYGSWAEVEEALGTAYAEVTGRVVPRPDQEPVLKQVERVRMGWSFSEIGYSYLDIGKVEKAKHFFEQAARIGQEQRERWLESTALSHLGIAYRNLGELGQALKVTEQALRITHEISNLSSMGPTLTNLGECYRQIGRLEEAAHCQRESFSITCKIGDREGQATALANLGACYYYLEHFEEAVRTLKEALVIQAEIGDRGGEMTALGNLGNCYLRMGHLEDAVRCQTQSLEVARRIGNRIGEGNALGNLGNCYHKLGLLKETQEAWLASIEVKEEIGNVIGVANTCYNLAGLLAQQGRIEEALPLAERAVQIYSYAGAAQDAEDARRLVGKLRAAPKSQVRRNL